MIYFFVLLLSFSAKAECLKDWGHLYQGPGKYFGIQWDSSPQTPLKVLKTKGSWSQVEEFDGVQSWVETKYLSKDNFCAIVKVPTKFKQSPPWVKKKDYFSLPYTTRLKVTKFHKNWTLVESLKGEKFWVQKKRLWVY